MTIAPAQPGSPAAQSQQTLQEAIFNESELTPSQTEALEVQDIQGQANVDEQEVTQANQATSPVESPLSNPLELALADESDSSTPQAQVDDPPPPEAVEQQQQPSASGQSTPDGDTSGQSIEDQLENNLDPDQTQFEVVRFKGTTGNVDQKFYFAMLPAIKVDNVSGTNFTTNDTPGATEGISILTKMRYKNKVTPGGHPVVDAVGLESKVIRLVGRITGYENAEDLPDPQVSNPQDKLPIPSIYNNIEDEQANPPYHSYRIAQSFSRNIVEKGGEVRIRVEDRKLRINFYGVIVNFQIYVSRDDLTYYQMDCLATRYSND